MTEATEQLPNYEEQFKDRFSSEDEVYQEYANRPDDPPPIVDNWRGHGSGNARGRGNRFPVQHGNRDYESRRNVRRDYAEHQQWRDRDRHWEHRSGHQSSPRGYNQGYNSYNKRPHYDQY